MSANYEEPSFENLVRANFLASVHTAKPVEDCIKAIVKHHERILSNISIQSRERWIDVVGYEGKYQVSDYGGVKSTPRKATKGGLLKQSKVAGYPVVSLSNGKGRLTLPVHRLVAKHFVPNPKLANTVNHMDGNKTNNHYTNLEWCSQSENAAHAWATGLVNTRGANNGLSKLSESDVDFILDNLGTITAINLAKKFNVTVSLIHQIRRKESWAVYQLNRKAQLKETTNDQTRV